MEDSQWSIINVVLYMFNEKSQPQMTQIVVGVQFPRTHYPFFHQSIYIYIYIYIYTPDPMGAAVKLVSLSLGALES